ncbi:hypothetical protein Drose_01835 [Dactylosporangium roseum]|uniref:Uncharacterized protein n=1 Tax=Dactylosporangium roseum TaxID=47989 RepID=A0ABY5Z6G4_9ACTN|nr:hypothetical protein [Dactylosporangium roseum]UWZ37087.1 hypothetical protein Drose_01835 [Dactylosporangium roseum]
MKDYRTPETRNEALVLLEKHTERDGICEGCLSSWARLAEFPCSLVQSARRFLTEDGTDPAADPPQP